MRSLGIDPDVHTLGLAVVHDSRLERVAVARVKKTLNIEDYRIEMIRILPTVIEALLQDVVIDVAVIEGQEIYTGKSAATPQSILTLAHITGAAAALVARMATRVLIPRPAQWKGQVPKDIHQCRTYRALGLEYTKLQDYAYPSGCANVAKVQGFGKINQGDWKHLGDAAGLALWGIQQQVRA